MNTDELERTLTEALAHRADHTTVRTDVVFDRRPPARGRSPSGWRTSVVAASVVALAFAGLIAIQRHDGATHPGGSTTTPLRTVTGRLTLPAERGFVAGPAGIGAEGIGDANTWNDLSIYATDSSTPELDSAFIVEVQSEDLAYWWTVGDDAAQVTVRTGATPGRVTMPENGRRTVLFSDDGWIYRVTGINVLQPDLIEVAARVVRDVDNNRVLVAAGLPEGVTLQTTGQYTADKEQWWFVSRAGRSSTPWAVFQADTRQCDLYYFSSADADMARLGRLFYDSVTEVDVDGSPGYVGTVGDGGGQADLVWLQDGRTHVLIGAYAADDLITFAGSLRPATDDEWAEMEAVPFPMADSQESSGTCAA